jgi:preprotein translocase subunit SecG
MGIVSVLILIVCVLLILIVLVQNSKGGGLSSGFASNNQYMGVRKTSDFLEKATWGLAGLLLILSLASSPRSSSAVEGTATGVESATKKRANAAPAASAPSTQAPAPAQAPTK